MRKDLVAWVFSGVVLLSIVILFLPQFIQFDNWPLPCSAALGSGSQPVKFKVDLGETGIWADGVFTAVLENNLQSKVALDGGEIVIKTTPVETDYQSGTCAEVTVDKKELRPGERFTIHAEGCGVAGVDVGAEVDVWIPYEVVGGEGGETIKISYRMMYSRQCSFYERRSLCSRCETDYALVGFLCLLSLISLFLLRKRLMTAKANK